MELIILSADFSAETLQARSEWHGVFKVMKGKRKTYNQKKYSMQQGYHSGSKEEKEILQTNKS